MTRGELKKEMKTVIKDCRSFDDVIDNLTEYIVKNFKLKKRVVHYGKKNKFK